MENEIKVSSEPTSEDPIVNLRAELQREREEKVSMQEEFKKMRKQLTEAQQDASQSTTFLKTIIPRLNKLEETKSKKRNFVSDWEEDPESAVVSRMEDRVATLRDEISPVSNEQRLMKHKMALLSLKQKYPDFSELEPRIAEISQSDPVSAAWSWTEEGLEKLYRVAREEKLSKKLEEKTVEEKKDRAFTEESSHDISTSKGKRSLSPQEKRLCKQLGLTEKQYMDNYMEGVENAED